jgi:hypothetical protein
MPGYGYPGVLWVDRWVDGWVGGGGEVGREGVCVRGGWGRHSPLAARTVSVTAPAFCSPWLHRKPSTVIGPTV